MMKLGFFRNKEPEIKEIDELNKKFKEGLNNKKPLDENLLVSLLKKANSFIYNYSNIILSNPSLINELNINDIEKYLQNYKDKPYFETKIYPLIQAL